MADLKRGRRIAAIELVAAGLAAATIGAVSGWSALAALGPLAMVTAGGVGMLIGRRSRVAAPRPRRLTRDLGAYLGGTAVVFTAAAFGPRPVILTLFGAIGLIVGVLITAPIVPRLTRDGSGRPRP